MKRGNNWSETDGDSCRVVIPEIPTEIMRSPLMKSGGFQVFEGVADEFIWQSLYAEAIRGEKIVENSVDNPDTEEIRGGVPRRSFLNSSGGEFQRAFYNSPWMLDLLRGLTTPNVEPTGGNGTYTFYAREGDFLDVHRDIIACDVAVITCLRNEGVGVDNSGELCLYPGRLDEPISLIRATPNEGAVKVRLEERQTIVMYGGIIPHSLLPMGNGQSRIVSVLCYRAI